MESRIDVQIGDSDADGICVATVFADGRHVASFETTQAEMNVLALQLGGYAVPADMIAAAEAEEARRTALGRTLQEEIPRQTEGGRDG